MKKKVLLIFLVLILVLLTSGGSYWWFALRTQNPHKQMLMSKAYGLPDFTLSVKNADGTIHYLILGLAVDVQGASMLKKGWIKDHDEVIRASILSSLLDLPYIAEASTNPAIRAGIRKEVALDMDRILDNNRSGYKVQHVYITKLILQ